MLPRDIGHQQKRVLGLYEMDGKLDATVADAIIESLQAILAGLQTTPLDRP